VSQRLLFSVVLVSLGLLCRLTCPPLTPAKPPAVVDEAVQRYVPLLKDDDPLVRKRAAVALKRLGAKAKAAIPALEEALADKDADITACRAGSEVSDDLNRAEPPGV